MCGGCSGWAGPVKLCLLSNTPELPCRGKYVMEIEPVICRPVVTAGRLPGSQTVAIRRALRRRLHDDLSSTMHVSAIITARDSVRANVSRHREEPSHHNTQPLRACTTSPPLLAPHTHTHIPVGLLTSSCIAHQQFTACTAKTYALWVRVRTRVTAGHLLSCAHPCKSCCWAKRPHVMKTWPGNCQAASHFCPVINKRSNTHSHKRSLATRHGHGFLICVCPLPSAA